MRKWRVRPCSSAASMGSRGLARYNLGAERVVIRDLRTNIILVISAIWNGRFCTDGWFTIHPLSHLSPVKGEASLMPGTLLLYIPDTATF